MFSLRFATDITLQDILDSHHDTQEYNLSDPPLTNDQKQVLSQGLKFCPNPGAPDPCESWGYMDRLHRRIRQIAFFEDSDKDQSLNATTAMGTPIL